MQTTTDRKPFITIIAATADNRVIGRDGGIPWDIPEDRRRFRELTMGHTLIMGRRTFDSIGRPLSGRRTIVLTRQAGWSAAGCETARDLAAALAACAGEEEVFVCGGAAVYCEALALASRICLTLVPGAPAGDTFFPPIPDDFVELSRETLPGPSAATFLVFGRAASPAQT